jgi:hypothetical protein
MWIRHAGINFSITPHQGPLHTHHLPRTSFLPHIPRHGREEDTYKQYDLTPSCHLLPPQINCFPLLNPCTSSATLSLLSEWSARFSRIDCTGQRDSPPPNLHSTPAASSGSKTLLLTITPTMATTDRASTGGVRSLRAMFENQNQNQNQNQEPSTPNNRGRSPVGNGTATNGDSARPLSKVRTSFVPVDGFKGNGLKSAATSQEREPAIKDKSEYIILKLVHALHRELCTTWYRTYCYVSLEVSYTWFTIFIPSFTFKAHLSARTPQCRLPH